MEIPRPGTQGEIETDLVSILTLNNINTIRLKIKADDYYSATPEYADGTTAYRVYTHESDGYVNMDLATLDELIETLTFAAMLATNSGASIAPNRFEALKMARGGNT